MSFSKAPKLPCRGGCPMISYHLSNAPLSQDRRVAYAFYSAWEPLLPLHVLSGVNKRRDWKYQSIHCHTPVPCLVLQCCFPNSTYVNILDLPFIDKQNQNQKSTDSKLYILARDSSNSTNYNLVFTVFSHPGILSKRPRGYS